MNEEPNARWNVEDASYLELPNDEKKTAGSRFKAYCASEGLKILFIVVYLAGNVGLFVYSYLKYFLATPESNLVAFQAFGALGQGVAIARGAANALKLNCVFILIPVLRNFLSWLRGTWMNNVLPIDKNITFHKWIGWTILFWSIVHATAHYTNMFKVSSILPHGTPLPNALGANGVVPERSVVLCYLRLTGATGHGALLCLVVMCSAAVETVRRRYFEIFWYSHHLFIVFFGCLLAHGMAELFEPAVFWMWFVGPGTLYLVERIIRIVRGSVKVRIAQAIQHPSKVIEVRLQREDGKPFKYKSGQYCYLNSPDLARTEWHPFTITSAPNGDPYLSFHIKDAGDWTGGLQKLLNPSGHVGAVECSSNARLRVDGPYGAASEDVFEFETVVLIGAGIGVTPFGSILKNIQYTIVSEDQGGYRFDDDGTVSPLLGRRIRQVHFFWVCRDRSSFEWFTQLLKELEEHNLGDYLSINIFLTGKAPDAATMMQPLDSDVEFSDSVTGLKAQTTFGRPDWDEIFGGLSRRHRGARTGVFFCGPKVLSNILKTKCKEFSDAKSKTRFVYKKENF